METRSRPQLVRALHAQELCTLRHVSTMIRIRMLLHQRALTPLDAFRAAPRSLLANCKLLTEGVDEPGLQLVVPAGAWMRARPPEPSGNAT